MLSCGDNWHLGADAAVDTSDPIDAAPACACPAAEPPLADRFVVVNQFAIAASNDIGYQGARCPDGSLLISGSCTTDQLNPVRNVTLQQTGIFDAPPSAWNCSFRNNDPTPVTIRVSVYCLKPAP